MGATQQCCALAACNAARAKASRVSQGEPLAVVRVKGCDFDGCAVGLRKQGDAAVRHRAIYVHEEQFDLRGTLSQRRGDSGKTGQKKPSKTSIYPRSNFLSNSFNPRQRQLWGQVEFKNGLSVLAGQSWSLLTTDRKGLGPLHGKKVEALFAELKNQIGLRRLRLRRLKFVREQFFMAAAVQNIKRLVRFLSQGPQPPLPATT